MDGGIASSGGVKLDASDGSKGTQLGGEIHLMNTGIAVMAFALMRALGDHDSRYEPPVPPGDPGGIW